MTELAINGGVPVRKTMLPYAHQTIGPDDIDAVTAVLNSDWLTTGPKVQEFEELMMEYTGAKAAIAVNTGTAALHSAVFALDIKPGDEVIVTPLTFVASSNCILYMGGTPVFADICSDTLNLDPVEVEKKITSKTKAIVAVDFTGQPCDHDELRKIAEKYKLNIIEDAAHSLGGTYNGRKVGTLQDITTLSFHPVKQITTGEGGMVLTDNLDLANRVRSFRHHGIDMDFKKRNISNLWYYDVVNLGFNYRITDISCALGISQMKKLDGWLERRREIIKQYDQGFSSLLEIEIPKIAPGCESAWHLYIIRLNLHRLQVNREAIYKALRAENIGVNVHYIPIPWLSLYQKLGYKKGECPVSEQSYDRMITLPLYPAMSDRDVRDVIHAVEKVITEYRA